MDTKRTNNRSNAGESGPGRDAGIESEIDSFNDSSDDPPALEPAFDEQLRTWLAQTNAEKLPVKVELYKYDNAVGGQAKSLIDSFENDIPDADTIGMNYGSGKYILIVTVPKSEKQALLIQSRTIRIHQSYDIKRRNRAFTPLGGPGSVGSPQAPMIPPSQGIDTVLALFERFMAMLSPILARSSTTPGAEMASMYASMNQIFKNQAIENMGLINDMTRKLTQIPYENGEEGEEGPDMDTPQAGQVQAPTILEQILPFINQFLPLILGKGPVAAATAASVQQLPQFKKVIQSPNDIKVLVDYLDKKEGKEKTDKVLARFKIKRP